MPNRLLPCLFVLTLLGLPAPADTITLFPSADTCLFERDPDNNWGAQSEIVSGTLNTGERARCLLQFDISSGIPAGSTIVSAFLRMRCVRTPPSASIPTFGLYRVGLPWSEGAQASTSIPGGDTAISGETTWQSRIHPSTAWTSPGGKLEVDFAEDPSASQLVTGVGNYLFNFNGEGISDLQSMLVNPASNFGWALVVEDEGARKSGRRWASREHPTNPPSLEIEFTPPPPPAPLEILASEVDPLSGELVVQFQAVAGIEYALDTRPDLTTGDWQQVDTVVAATSGIMPISTIPPEDTRRLFFRIRTVP